MFLGVCYGFYVVVRVSMVFSNVFISETQSLSRSPILLFFGFPY